MPDAVARLRAALADRYRIERELGAGGMATVYLAEDLKHTRKVAVKVLRPDLAAVLGPERFLREIEVAARLTHPHILPLHDSGDADGFLFYVMPFIDGESLRDRLTREGSLPIGDAVRILREVVDALASAHGMGVVHRDIKPDNVMLSQNHALVTDFGVAKAVTEATGRAQLTTAGVALGTPAYMAPEQASGEQKIDHRADIYAVGVLAFELLAGRTPFTGTTSQMVLAAHLATPPQPITDLRASVPPALATLVMRCLEKDRADRWQTSTELLVHLEALSTPSGGVTPTHTIPVRRTPFSRRRTIGWIAATAAVSGALGAYALGWLGGDRVTESLIDDLVLVTVFDNQTGDESLDHVGKVLADLLARGIEATGLAEVVDPQIAVAGAPGLDVEVSTNQEVARALGAATIVGGIYFRRGDSIQIQASIVATRTGNLIAGTQPVMAPVDDPLAAGQSLADRILGAVAARFGRLDFALQAARVPRSYEAYQEFVTGLELGRTQDWNSARLHFERAVVIDSTFYPAAIYLALVFATVGPASSLDSIVGWLGRERDQLSEFERLWLDHYEAYVQRNLARSYRALKSLSTLRPNDAVQNYMLGQYAFWTGRLPEAVDVLTRPQQTEYTPRYWGNVTQALHLLGEHERELDMATAGRVVLPDSRGNLNSHVRALIGLGRIGDVRVMVSEIMNLPEGLAGSSLTNAARELRAHGFHDDSHDFSARAIAWFRDRLATDSGSYDLRHQFGHALYVRGSWAAAAEVFATLYDEHDRHLDLGMMGASIAQAGRRAEALGVDERLASLDQRLLRGRPTLHRGYLAAALGDRERAVDLLIQAHQQGQNYGLWLHTALSLDSLRGYERFEEFARPK